MSITLKNITLRNFLSIGAVCQAIDLDKKDLTLILGENLDLGGSDSGSRNGTGKTTLIQGISYALFGSAINNIKKDNLINRTNQKGMQVSIDFNSNGVDYKIVRGRKPNVLKFYINDKEQQASDDSQGDSRETQDAIERVLRMTNDMFRQIIALNTYNEPFLAMKVSDQRMIIEQLLGITLLSEKAEAIKELNKSTKEDIQKEEYRIRGTDEANKRIQEQIDSLKKRQRLWNAKHDEDLLRLVSEYDDLSKINIDVELQSHKDLAVYNANFDVIQRHNALVARQLQWKQKRETEVRQLLTEFEKLNSIDIAAELDQHKLLSEYNKAVVDHDTYTKTVARVTKESKQWSSTRTKLVEEVTELKEHRCYACGQEFHDQKHTEVLEKKLKQLREAEEHCVSLASELASLVDNPVVVPSKPSTFYKTETEAIKHSSEVDRIVHQIETKESEVDPYKEQLEEYEVVDLGTKPETHYDTEEEAIKHSSRISTLLDQIHVKHEEHDPYTDQITEMTEAGLQLVNFDELNKLKRVLQHQEYLLDLLTNKKSFVRKRIISQNLSFLNSRLSMYLTKLGLPHNVVFQDDLTVEITELGRDLDFHNLSRGEMNRVILALSFAFRDTYESLYSPVNVLFIDELIDSGMDAMGVENSLALLKDMVRRRNKSVWLVSHKDELANRVNSVLKVYKESGFTRYASSLDYITDTGEPEEEKS